MKNKKYYKYLDFIRLLSCIGVFLYHLNILKGGYLAVCIFFVLTGYLSFISSFNKENFSIKNYYIDRLKHIYLPFILIVFTSIFIISLFPSINWINLKPETTSVIFGYNNFWQLNASLDYFARHIDSPFMHFWYIAILLQFELVFPIIFTIFKRISKKINKVIPLIILIILSLLGTSYFVYSSFNQNIMFVYYNTFTRIFSILLGITLGYINCYYKKMVIKNKTSKYIFAFYLVIICVSFFIIDSTSKYFSLFMILTSIISCRLIEYSTSFENSESPVFDKIIKSLSSVSYEIYLIQYPIIFMFQEFGITSKFVPLLVIVITIILSYVLHFSLNLRKDKDGKIKFYILKIIILFIIVLISSFGFYKYLIAKDYTLELKELENELNSNQELMKENQAKYALQLEEEENAWKLAIENLENDEVNLNEVIKNLHVVGIGDSVMLGAVKSLYQVFPKGYFDAKTSRTDWEANGILQRLSSKGMLGDTIIFGLGTNGQCGAKCRTKILKTCGNKKMFWITTTNKKTSYINDELKSLAKNDSNTYIIDWANESKGHNDYFLADKIHLTYVGKEAYSKYIYNEIYNVYLNELKEKKEKMLEEHNEKERLKINFYGNDLLLNSFEYLKETFKESKYETINDYNELYLKLNNDVNSNSLTNKYVLLFNSSFQMNEEEYKRLIDLLNNKKVYVLFINSKYNLNYQNVNVINFDKEILSNNNYLLVDRVHLSDEGSLSLVNRLKDIIE